MKPEVDTFAELDFRELFERNGKLAVRYIETLQAVIAAQDKCIRAMTAALKQSTAKGACARGNPYARSGK